MAGIVKAKTINIMENLKKLAELNDLAQQEGTKFAAGNKSAGTRLRKVLLDIKNLSHEIRKEVSEKKSQ